MVTAVVLGLFALLDFGLFFRIRVIIITVSFTFFLFANFLEIFT